jgi:hypothetical protein
MAIIKYRLFSKKRSHVNLRKQKTNKILKKKNLEREKIRNIVEKKSEIEERL